MHPARRVLPSPAEQAQSPSRIAAFPEHAAACGVVGHPEDSYLTGSLEYRHALESVRIVAGDPTVGGAAVEYG